MGQTVEVTWGIALRIWAWLVLRIALAGIVGGLVIGFVIGLIGVMVGMNINALTILVYGISIPFGIFIFCFFFRKLVGHKFKDFTLVLVKPESVITQ